MSEAIKNRYEFVVLFDVENGNPNGDPDAGNLPRVDAETGMGLVTDVCLKRKVRNYVQVEKQCATGYDIFIKEKAVLNTLIEQTHNSATQNNPNISIREAMCDKYYDVRAFGAVLMTGNNKNAGQVRGPIQMTFARSIDQIAYIEHSITRMAVTNEVDKDKERTMGRKSTVPYGLYLCHGFISANLARQTGFTTEDLALFFDALKNMFDNDRSAARGLMSAQKLIVFRHDSELGNAPANKLFDLVKVERKEGVEVPRSFNDYTITINRQDLPAGVAIEEML